MKTSVEKISKHSICKCGAPNFRHVSEWNKKTYQLYEIIIGYSCSPQKLKFVLCADCLDVLYGAIRPAITALREKQERESEPRGWVRAKREVPINDNDVIVIDDIGQEHAAYYSVTKEAWFKNGILMVNDVIFWKRRPKEEVL